MPAEGSRNQSRPITSLRFLQPQPTASSEGKETAPRTRRHQTSAAATSKLSTGTLASDGFAGGKGLPRPGQLERTSLLKPMSARLAPVQQGTTALATTEKNADPIRQQPSTTTTNHPTPRRPKRLLATENEVQQWEREADRVDNLRRAKTPRTMALDDGGGEMAVVAAAMEDEDMATAGETETEEEPLPTREEEEEKPAAAILRPISFLQPSRPATNRATAIEQPVPPARRPDKSPVAAAVYDLSSLAPIVSRRPKFDTSGPRPPPLNKPKLPPGPGAPQPVALSKITSAVFVPVDKTKKQKEPSIPHAALSAFRPPPLTLAASSTGGNGMDDGQEGQEVEVEEWSPKKRKGGYLASGMAARASSLLSAARTEQTLWLHDFSRRLAKVAAAPCSNNPTTTTTRATLAAELRPDLRLKVLQVLSFGNDEADSFMTPDRRRERRTTLAVCRLVRDRDPADAASSMSMKEPSTRETQGLVLFSLHDHHFGGSSSSSTSSVPLPSSPSPTKNLRPGATTTNNHNHDDDDDSSSARTLAVPTIPPDLRLIRPGAEVWVWEPFHQVGLVGAEDVRFDGDGDAGQVPTSTQERGTPVPVGDVSVQWQNGSAAADAEADFSASSGVRNGGGSEAVAKKGLVCGRFAILT